VILDGMTTHSLVSVVAGNVRQRRLDAGLSQDQLAHRLHVYGLDWSRNNVAALENGSRNVDAAELLLLAAAFRLSPAELLETTATEVRVGAVRVPGPELAKMVTDPAAVVDHGKRIEHVEANLLEAIRTALTQAGAKPTARRVKSVTEAMHRQAEREAAQRLGVSAPVVTAIAVALWGRSLTDERDRRDPEATGMAKSWVTRRLIAELRERGRSTGMIEEEEGS